MVYHVGNMILHQTQEIFRGKVNDVIVCQNMADSAMLYYTVWVVHDRQIAKKLMQTFHADRKQKTSDFVADFTWKDSYLMVFEYVRERPLQQFFDSEIADLSECEELAMNLTVECMSAGLPYSILYLQLLQDQIHITIDKNIYLGYAIDLESFSPHTTERECATLCAQKIFPLLGKASMGKKGRPSRAPSYKLLESRSWKSGYHRFTDLYKDLKMAALPLKKDSIRVRIQKFFRYYQDQIFRLLLVCSVLAAILALILLVSQTLFGDVPFLRLFINTFKQIGTESLLQ